VIATAHLCEEKQGSSKIEMDETSTTVVLEHLPRRMIVLSPKTAFALAGNKYYWKGYTDLFEEKTDKLLAQLISIEGDDDKTGELIVSEGDNKQFNDLVIISAFIMHQRSEARKRAVLSPKFHSNLRDLLVEDSIMIEKVWNFY